MTRDSTAAGASTSAPTSRWSGIFMAVVVVFGGILSGYSTGNITGLIMMDDWKQTFGEGGVSYDGKVTRLVTYSQMTVGVSLLSAGMFIGALFGAPAADRFGRRGGTPVACVVFSLGVALQIWAPNWGTFKLGRAFAGLGVGLVSTLVLIYQAECAPKRIRGAVVAGNQWAVTFGVLLTNVISNATKDLQNHSAWQIPLAIQFIWAAMLMLGMFWLPESPRRLIKRGRPAEATKSLSRLLSLPPTDPEITAEIAEIEASLKAEQALGKGSYCRCFKSSKSKIRLRTLTGISIQAMQQLTGIGFIFYCSPSFFIASGVRNPFLVYILPNIVNVVMGLPALWAVERVGRRPLLLWGAALMCVCEFLVAIIGVTISIENKIGQQALIALVCMFIAVYAGTWGPIPWVVTAEIFPLNVRAKATALCVASNWLFNWAIAFGMPYLVDPIQGGASLGAKVFFIWGATCLGCVAFTYFCVPETKGLSLEQIDLLYRSTVPRRSVQRRNDLFANDTRVADVVGEPGRNSVDEKQSA